MSITAVLGDFGGSGSGGGGGIVSDILFWSPQEPDMHVMNNMHSGKTNMHTHFFLDLKKY